MNTLQGLIRLLQRVRLRRGRADEDDGRVLHLFHNRAQLKKSYSGLQEELQRLKDRIKQQEGATARVQEMLAGLEARLGRPDTGYPALVFYQLRELWTLGRTLLTQFVAELAAQCEQRERRQFVAEYNRRQFVQRQGVEAALHESESRAGAAREAVAVLEQRLAGRRRFWHYFQRRRLRRERQAAQLHSLLAIRDLDEARHARDAFEAQTPPQFPGLSLDARRTINLAAIAYGQILCDRLARTQLLRLAREAAARREPPREDYGDRARCEAMMGEIVHGRTLLQQRTNLPALVRERCAQLQGLARYRGDADTLPSADALALAGAGSTRVLADDCWEIYRVLLR